MKPIDDDEDDAMMEEDDDVRALRRRTRDAETIARLTRELAASDAREATRARAMETHRERVKEMEGALREREDELSRAVRVEESRERRWEMERETLGTRVRDLARRVDATETEARREREAYESTREALRKAEEGLEMANREIGSLQVDAARGRAAEEEAARALSLIHI